MTNGYINIYITCKHTIRWKIFLKGAKWIWKQRKRRRKRKIRVASAASVVVDITHILLIIITVIDIVYTIHWETYRFLFFLANSFTLFFHWEKKRTTKKRLLCINYTNKKKRMSVRERHIKTYPLKHDGYLC